MVYKQAHQRAQEGGAGMHRSLGARERPAPHGKRGGVVENYSLFVMQNINIDYDIIGSADTTLLSPPTDIDIDDV